MDTILMNQSHMEDITLKEANGSLTLLDDTDIGNFSFREEDAPFDNLDESLMSLNISLEDKEKIDSLLKGNKASVGNKVKYVKKSHTTDERKLGAVCKYNDKDVLNSEFPEDEIPESIEFAANINDDINHAEADNFDVPTSHFNDEIHNLNLEPVIISTNDVSQCKKIKKRKHFVDYKKCISYRIIKKQVLDTSDITRALEVAPVSKMMMILKEIGSAGSLFHLPATKLQNRKLLKLYQRNLKTCKSENFELISEEEESIQMPRKKCRKDSLEELAVNENFDVSSESNRRNTICPVDTDVSALDDFMIDTDHGLEEEAHHLSPTTLPINISSNDTGDIASNQLSKTSEEKWQYAFQGRIIQMLRCLKLLFEEKSVIKFSSLTQNDKKLSVSRKFLSLLMLKKFQVIDLEQTDTFKEIFISPSINFDSAGHKYCS